MSAQRRQIEDDPGRVTGAACGRMKDWQDRVYRGAHLGVSRTRTAFGLMLVVVLGFQLALTFVAPAEAVLRRAPTRTPDVLGDEYWSPGFSRPGIQGEVRALMLGPEGSFYAGGSLYAAGTTVNGGIARWDGSQWLPLSSGLGSHVYALALAPDGSLYTGGSFTVVSGAEADYIARWDGSQWHPMGSGMDWGTVFAMAVGPDGSLYAGGNFSSAGGVTAYRIARWDGSQWQALGSGIGGDDQMQVNALAFRPYGLLYVGGWFVTAGDKASSSFAQWSERAPRPPGVWFPVAQVTQ